MMRLLAYPVCVLLLAAAPLQPRIWILPFENLRADESLEYLEQALPALLAVAVSRSDKHAVIERQQLDQVLAEQSLTLEGLTSPETRHKIGRLAGATVVISGSFVRQEPDLLLSMRATDLETGLVVATAEDAGPAGQPDRLVRKLYRRLARKLNRRLPELGPDRVDEAPLSNLHFMRGLGYYYGARYNQALAEFMEAAREERLTDLARLWLANTYMAQHRYSHARLELNRLKREASGSVPADEVEAKLRICEKNLSAGDLGLTRNGAAAEDTLVLARPQQTEPLHVFGNRTVDVPLLIHAPRPDGLTLRAELVQRTARLSVPIGDALDLPLTASGELDLPVPLPAVKRETSFELRIRAHREGDPSPRPAGRIALRVYPEDLLAPVRAWAKSHALRVEDDHGSLTQFLRQEDIRIAGVRTTPDVTLRTRPQSSPKAEQTVVLFTERQTDLPHLVVERSGRGTVVTVKMRLLDRLANDPSAQKIFLEVFRLLHDEQPPTIGDFQ